MTIEGWDPDQAVLLATSDADESEDEAAVVDRYGVTGWESSHHEPLSVALSQEEPESTPANDEADDQWLDVEGDAFPGRLVPDVQEADDDYAVAVVDPAEYAPEERAMHIVES